MLATTGQATARLWHLASYRAVYAHTTVLVTPQGVPVGGKWQRWVDEAKIPTYHGTIVFGNLNCGDATACSSGNQVIRGPYDKSVGGPYQITVVPTGVADFDRGGLYWELGHVFDAAYLTPPARRVFARVFGDPHWHWWDTVLGLERGGEDGLEAAFAAVYQDCASGVNDSNAYIGLGNPTGVSTPPIAITKNPCPVIKQLG